ncbi:hypothetical protein D9611_002114 [Ephemerocybe angulata]|uniref:NACHT domain-containing protein n=1 Tax=Ephemerocybe angulata TaxID=980116 RepID=A0A8H5CI95_9AGAR|nr:hypothetical protein D9611_002114 [Tulosesus angulatus]
MAHASPSHFAATPPDHDGFRSPRSVPAASGGLDATQGLASTSPAGSSSSSNLIQNTSIYYGPVHQVKKAKNVSMGPNHGTINQDSGPGELEEQSYLAALDFLSKHMAAGAIHDSKERCDAPKCMPETRVAVQDEILSWITDGHKDTDPKRILWVTGPAGTGKTAILGTIAERCKTEGTLAATFFFSSFSASPTRRSKTCLVSTLAYQLLQHAGLPQVGQFRTRMSQAIRRDPAILQKRLQTQLDELILHPLRHGVPTGARPMPRHRMAIIIDGLDECDYVEDRFGWSASARISSGVRWTKEDEQREILSALLHAATDPSFPFVIIIASRPELAIREFFSTGPARDATRELFLDDKYKPDADILLFYDFKFSYIRRRFNLSPKWPGEEVVLQLVSDASGQFIYAATVIRFVEGPPPGTQDAALSGLGLRTPHQRLVRVLKLRTTRAHTPNIRPLEPLDMLYGSVLKTCSEPLLSMKWLGAITFLGAHKLSVSSVPAQILRLWVEQSPGEEVYVLGPLSSLIYIPSDPDCSECYSFYHKSFVDFFVDESRCVDLYVSPNQTCDFLSQRYFENLDNRRFSLLEICSCTANSYWAEDLHSIPRHLVYRTLDYNPGDPAMFIFSTKEAFKTAERAMLSCDAWKWAEYFTAPGTDVLVDRRVTIRHLILRMFYVVHVWCSKIRCRRACKHWRKAILDVARRRGWNAVPTPSELFRDSRVLPYTLAEMYRFFYVPYEQTNND